MPKNDKDKLNKALEKRQKFIVKKYKNKTAKSAALFEVEILKKVIDKTHKKKSNKKSNKK